MRSPVIVRLNAATCPMIAQEREILAVTGAIVREIEGADEAEMLAFSGDCDALMVVSARVSARAVEALARCRLISRLGTGVDKIDVEAATRCGIMVTNLPDFCTDEVADHTLALLLTVARRLDDARGAMREGRPPRQWEGIHRLSTQTLAIVGFGRIGRAVARRARGFGMRVLAADPFASADEVAAEGASLVGFDAALAESDYLVLLCPLTDDTRGMLAVRELRRMKPTAVLINTGRGELVNEGDLVDALREGLIRGAALDVFGGISVFAPDGFATDHPFFSLPNVIMTPHLAAGSAESALEQKVRGAQAVVDVLSGRWPEHLVNPDVVPWFDITPSASAGDRACPQ